MAVSDKTSPLRNQTALPPALHGYIEGYYGRLLDWDDRTRLLHRLSSLGLNAYLYAPKEDECHRFEWRRPWDKDWLASFSRFCKEARRHDVCVLGGIAPGLDYDAYDDVAEFGRLLAKAQQLQDSGAQAVVLMFDDIDEPPAGGWPIEKKIRLANDGEVGAEYEFVVVSREVSVRALTHSTRLLRFFIRGGASYERAEISPASPLPCSPPGRERSADALAAAHPLRPGVGSRGGDVCE